MRSKGPWNRAKIFQPFDALPGLRELLREKEREHEARYNANGNEVAGEDNAKLPPDATEAPQEPLRPA